MVKRNTKSQTALKGLGVKFGATVRKRYGTVYKTLKQKRRCPTCSSLRFDRIASGIWYCPKCNLKVASGAYDINIEKLQS
ncbi:MAG TPA: 50S ribosomal protein L37 [Nitrososphaeraceae archaeon]|jgi:large subunit ribosomal protein L37Ae|nr:50S ribosomal protein L37 [Nitrososphaeraceae archaeon]